MWSLITKGIIYKIITKPTISVDVTISNPAKLEVDVKETNKLNVIVKD